MARRSRMSVLKRQRELRKSEKASRKRAKRHGLPEEGLREPVPSVGLSGFGGLEPVQQPEGEAPAEQEPGEELELGAKEQEPEQT